MVQKKAVKPARLVIIGGPTASGKSGLAMCLAKKLNGEIVSADSMQIYRGLDIGTAKPSSAERAEVRHHLVDIREPNENYNVSEYQRAARAKIDILNAANKRAVVCGGTGLYINAILFDYTYGAAPEDMKVRAALIREYDEKGADFMHDRLKQVDPDSAAKLHKNDKQRIVRALEIYALSGKTKASFMDAPETRPAYEYDLFVLNCERELLYKRINDRVDLMLKAGLVSEVENLLAAGVSPEAQAMQAIGYKETAAYLNKKLSYDGFIEALKQNTRNYAKRQITYFKGMKNAVWLDAAKGTEKLCREITESII